VHATSGQLECQLGSTRHLNRLPPHLPRPSLRSARKVQPCQTRPKFPHAPYCRGPFCISLLLRTEVALPHASPPPTLVCCTAYVTLSADVRHNSPFTQISHGFCCQYLLPPIPTSIPAFQHRPFPWCVFGYFQTLGLGFWIFPPYRLAFTSVLFGVFFFG